MAKLTQNKSERQPNHEMQFMVAAIILFVLIVLVFAVGVFIPQSLLSQINEPFNETFTRFDAPHFESFLLPGEYDSFLERFMYLTQTQNKSIHCALRSLNHVPAENALLSAEQRGVKVRIVIDNDYITNKRIHLPFVFFSRQNTSQGLMHHNFCIFDETIVMTGSTIFNNNTILQTYHDSVFINSSNLAEAYSSEFWKLYLDKAQTNKSTPGEYIDEKYEVLFCPQDTCVERYVQLIDSAQKTIRFGTYALTHNDIENALVRAKNRGVSVRGYVENVGITKGSIAERSMPGVFVYDGEYFMHMKFMVFDGKTTLTGTFNPSYTAQTLNNENILVIHDHNVSDYYTNIFNIIASRQNQPKATQMG